MSDLSRSVAIVGVAESDEVGKIENKSNLQFHAEAAYNAIKDAEHPGRGACKIGRWCHLLVHNLLILH